jgi:hypothetical protein
MIKRGLWPEASRYFSLQGENKKNEMLKELSAELLEGDLIAQKSPSLAGTLSALLPGAGQLYVGRKRDAVVSFLLNGAFILGAIEAFRKDENAVGGILIMFETGWYAGNIYSAISGAHKYNRKISNDFIGRLENRYGLGIYRDNGIIGTLNIRFD